MMIIEFMEDTQKISVISGRTTKRGGGPLIHLPKKHFLVVGLLRRGGGGETP